MDNNLKFVRYAAVIIFLLLVIYFARRSLTPFLISLLAAYILEPVVSRLEEKGISRGKGAAGIIAVIITAAALLLLSLYPVIKSQVENLTGNLPVYIEKVRGWIVPLIEQSGREDFKHINMVSGRIMENLGSLPGKLLAVTANWIWGTFTNIVSLLFALFNLVVAPMVTFYLLRDTEKLKKWGIGLVPPEWRDKTVGIASEVDSVLKAFLQGQLIVALILAFLYSAGLFLGGIPLGIPIGITAGLASIAPYLGVIVGFLPALVLSVVGFQDWFHPLYVVFLFGAVQVLEGFFITPRVVGDRVGLHPLAVLFALFAGGELFGFIGILAALPAAAIINVLIKHLKPVSTV